MYCMVDQNPNSIDDLEVDNGTITEVLTKNQKEDKDNLRQIRHDQQIIMIAITSLLEEMIQVKRNLQLMTDEHGDL